MLGTGGARRSNPVTSQSMGSGFTPSVAVGLSQVIERPIYMYTCNWGACTLYIFIYAYIYLCMYCLLMIFYAEKREQVRLLVVSTFEQELYFLSMLTYAAKQMNMYCVYTYSQLHS